MLEKIKKNLNSFYQEFMRMDDSPQSIALAFGMGVFLGILPFTGVVVAAALAWTLRLNKPAAILGSLLTNTWLSIVIFGIALNVGCLFLGVNNADVYSRFQDLIKDFQWQKLTDIYLLKLVAAVALGFLVVSLLCGILAYVICLGAICWQRRSR